MATVDTQGIDLIELNVHWSVVVVIAGVLLDSNGHASLKMSRNFKNSDRNDRSATNSTVRRS